MAQESMSETDGLAALTMKTEKWRKRFYSAGAIVLAFAVIWIIGFLMDVLSTPVGIIIWCIIFIFILSPVVDWLQRHGIGRGWGTFIAFVLLVAVLMLLVWLMVSPAAGIGGQFAEIAIGLPDYAERLNEWASGIVAEYSTLLENRAISDLVDSASSSLYKFVGNVSSSVGSGIVGLTTSIVNACVAIGFAAVISFWLLMDLPGIRREIMRIIPPKHRRDAQVVAGTLASSIGGYIKGALLECVIIGTASGVGYAIAGLPYAVALGIITGLFNIIPVVGPWIGGILAAIVGLMESPILALAVLIIAVAVQQVVYTFLGPVIMRDAVDIHPALMIFALMVGSAIGGHTGGLIGNILGMLAAVPLAASIKALFVYYYEDRTGIQVVAPDGVFFRGDIEEGAPDPASDASAPVPKIEASEGNPFKRHYPARHLSDEQKEQIRERRERLKDRSKRSK